MNKKTDNPTGVSKKLFLPDISSMTLPEGKITRLGTVAMYLVESTPIVWKGKLYLFMYMRANAPKAEDLKAHYYCFFDWETGEHSKPFGEGYDLGSAFVDGGTLYVFGVKGWGTSKIYSFKSNDMMNWECSEALSLPGWAIFNTSVTKNDKGVFTLVYEVSKVQINNPDFEFAPYMCFFAESSDLRDWRLLAPEAHNFKKEKFSACPCLKYMPDGFYYMIYLEVKHGVTVPRYYGPAYYSEIARTKDFKTWEEGKRPFMGFGDPKDRTVASNDFSPGDLKVISEGVNINASDVDMLEYKGKTIIMYAWGDQVGNDHLAVAAYPGTMLQLCKSFF